MSLLSGIVEHWKLDESSGNAIGAVSGTVLTNTNSVAYAAALINNGADFGAGNTNKKLANASKLTPNNSITIGGWFKLKSAIASGSWGLFEQEDDTLGIILNVIYSYNGGTPQIVADYHKNNASDNNIAATFTLSTSVFHHIAITYDGVIFTLYIDGVSSGTPLTISGGGSGSVNGNEFTVGLAPRYGGTYASVVADELDLYSRALAAAELLQIVNGGAGLPYPYSVYTPGPDLRLAFM